MKTTKLWRIAALAAVPVLALGACSTTGGSSSGSDQSGAAAPSSDGDHVVFNVVKLAGGEWFNRMEVGNQEWAEANPGWTVTQVAGDDSSEEKQIAVINDAIPQNPTALTVVPNSPQSVESVLKRAEGAGIIVVTHEAPSIQNATANIEAFDNKAYGAFQMETLADCMGGEGEYAQFVGSLTVASHNAWADGALAEAAENFPGITRVADPISSDESEDVAYQRTKELLATYPNIKGFLGAASTDIAGVGRAVQEAGKEDSTCVVGTSTPSTAGELLKTGAVDVITGWDPALAGEAMLSAVKLVTEGKTIEEGTDLGIPGYESLVKDPEEEKNFFGNAWISITTENVADYPF